MSIVKAYVQGVPAACWDRIVVSFIENIAGGVCFFLSLYFVRDLAMPVALSGLMIAAYGVGRASGGYLAGRLADHFSPTRIATISLLFMAVIYFLLVKVESSSWLFVLMLLLGIATYSFTTTNNLFVLNACKGCEKERLKTINVLYTVSNLGVGISAVLVSLVSYRGFKVMFVVSSLLLLGLAVYLWVTRHRQVEVHSHDELTHSDINTVEKLPVNRSRLLWIVLISVFFIGAVMVQRSTTYTIFIRHSFPDAGMLGVGILLALNPLLIIFFQVPVVNLFGTGNKLIYLGVGAFLIGLGTLMLSLSFYYWVAVLACIVYTFGEMIFISIAQLLCYQYSYKNKRGQSLGLFQSAYGLSVIAGPAVGGAIFKFYNGDILWVLSGLVGVVILLVMLRLGLYIRRKGRVVV